MTYTNMSAQKRNAFGIVAASASSLLAVMFLLPSLANAAFLSQQLDIGMTNSDVTSLQAFLSTKGSLYPEAIVNGHYGPLTAAAVSRFQTANGLPAVGRVGPQTLAAINAQMDGGISTNTGGDDSAPIIYPETVSTSPTSATISWTTSEAAHDRVMYAATWPFLYSTAASVTSTNFGSTANITLPSLQSHTTYYYVLESIDGSGNIMWTVGKPLLTQ